jgi:thioredoxin-like negative regulator of GroEL
MFGKQFERIGKNIGDLETKDSSLVKEGEIRLGQIEFGANTKLCKKLGVKKVPSLHFYSESKKVDGFPCGPKKISHTLERLNHYRSLSLSELSFEADMNKGKALGEDMLKEASTSDKKKKRRIF